MNTEQITDDLLQQNEDDPISGVETAGKKKMERFKVSKSERTFCCEECGKVAKTKQALERHAAYHKSDRPFACKMCSQRFKNSDDLGKHFRRLKRDGKYDFACRVCHKHFKSDALRMKHVEMLGCDSSIKEQTSKTINETIKSEDDLIHEKQCDTFSSLGKPNEEKVLHCFCKDCEREFESASILKAHYNSEHSELKRHVCLKCGQTLSSKDSLMRHHNIFHQNEFPYSCDLCFQKFKVKEGLCRHVKFVHKDGGYKCDICQRIFSQPVNLKKHMAVHSLKKEFVCELCHKEFRWKQSLQKHMLLHMKSSDGIKSADVIKSADGKTEGEGSVISKQFKMTSVKYLAQNELLEHISHAQGSFIQGDRYVDDVNRNVSFNAQNEMEIDSDKDENSLDRNETDGAQNEMKRDSESISFKFDDDGNCQMEEIKYVDDNYEEIKTLIKCIHKGTIDTQAHDKTSRSHTLSLKRKSKSFESETSDDEHKDQSLSDVDVLMKKIKEEDDSVTVVSETQAESDRRWSSINESLGVGLHTEPKLSQGRSHRLSAHNNVTKSASFDYTHENNHSTNEVINASNVEHKKALSAYEFHRHLEPSCTQQLANCYYDDGMEKPNAAAQFKNQATGIQTNFSDLTDLDRNSGNVHTQNLIEMHEKILDTGQEHTLANLNRQTMANVNKQNGANVHRTPSDITYRQTSADQNSQISSNVKQFEDFQRESLTNIHKVESLSAQKLAIASSKHSVNEHELNLGITSFQNSTNEHRHSLAIDSLNNISNEQEQDLIIVSSQNSTNEQAHNLTYTSLENLAFEQAQTVSNECSENSEFEQTQAMANGGSEIVNDTLSRKIVQSRKLSFRPSQISSILRPCVNKTSKDVLLTHSLKKCGDSNFKVLPTNLNKDEIIRQDLEEKTSVTKDYVEKEKKVGSLRYAATKSPTDPSLSKFSLIKHMLSLQNEEGFDKSLFDNPLYSLPGKLKSLQRTAEMHKVSIENGFTEYNLSVKQNIPFHWLGISVKADLSQKKDKTLKKSDLDVINKHTEHLDKENVEADGNSKKIVENENGLSMASSESRKRVETNDKIVNEPLSKNVFSDNSGSEITLNNHVQENHLHTYKILELHDPIDDNNIAECNTVVNVYENPRCLPPVCTQSSLHNYTQHLQVQHDNEQHDYTQPSQHDYTQTSQHDYTRPSQHDYTQLSQHNYIQPSHPTQDDLIQSSQHNYTQSSQHNYTQPSQHFYTQSSQHIYTQPSQHIYTQPSQHIYTQSSQHNCTPPLEHNYTPPSNQHNNVDIGQTGNGMLLNTSDSTPTTTFSNTYTSNVNSVGTDQCRGTIEGGLLSSTPKDLRVNKTISHNSMESPLIISSLQLDTSFTKHSVISSNINNHSIPLTSVSFSNLDTSPFPNNKNAQLSDTVVEKVTQRNNSPAPLFSVKYPLFAVQQTLTNDLQHFTKTVDSDL